MAQNTDQQMFFVPIGNSGHLKHQWLIPRENPVKINQMKQIEVDVTEIRLHMKVRDTFNSCLADAQGDEFAFYEGYVPGFFPGEHYGDYLILNIDLETGQIKNWVKPKPKDLEELIAKAEGD